MDQDFHYYGTHYAAMVGGGYTAEEATLIGRASNFIDFLHEGDYGGYWLLVSDTEARSGRDDYTVVGEIVSPRYTFQGGTILTGIEPEDGLWCSYHFLPGNMAPPPGTPSTLEIHGPKVAGALPGHRLRTVTAPEVADPRLLNRPQSPLSRALVADAIRCGTQVEHLKAILEHAEGGAAVLEHPNAAALLRRFALILTGVRGHVVADTWAHQDFSGLPGVENTYRDITTNTDPWARRAIDYQDVGSDWHTEVLSYLKSENFEAVPPMRGDLGHGWMGHFPDYGFVKYRYRPGWTASEAEPVVRDNPVEYRHAFLELCSLFARANGKAGFDPAACQAELDAANRAIASPCVIADPENCPRVHASAAWLAEMTAAGVAPPVELIDTHAEPDPRATMDGLLAHHGPLRSLHRYGKYAVNAVSDLYLFQIAADYHFRFVRAWLARHEVLEFTGGWSVQQGPLDPAVDALF